MNINWARSWDYGTYHMGDQWKLRRACTSRQVLAVRTHKVWKETKGPTKNQTFSPTGWLSMSVWKMSLRRTKSTIHSWDGSVDFLWPYLTVFQVSQPDQSWSGTIFAASVTSCLPTRVTSRNTRESILERNLMNASFVWRSLVIHQRSRDIKSNTWVR